MLCIFSAWDWRTAPQELLREGSNKHIVGHKVVLKPWTAVASRFTCCFDQDDMNMWPFIFQYLLVVGESAQDKYV